jgi:hypothetical protein
MALKETKGRKMGGVAASGRPLMHHPKAVTTGRMVGGVSGEAPGHALEIRRSTSGPGTGATAHSHADFVYNDGPVITCPFVYTSFWGSLWLTDAAHTQQAGRLTQFCTDLVNSTYMNVLSQYGVGSGRGSGLFLQASFIDNVPANLTDSDVHSVIQSAINRGAIPEPPVNNTTHILVIYLDENTAVNDPGLGIIMCEPAGDSAFGYHFDFTTTAGNPFYYAVIPALDDRCLRNSCSNDTFCSLHLGQTQEQRRTQVTSHEIAEMCTDPKFQTGWWGPSSDENGDICNGEADSITVGSNSWDVQRQYSKYDDINSNGAVFCITEAPTPLARLSPGPSGASAAMASAQRIGSYRPFLPLPSAHFDLRSKTLSLDESHIQRYIRKFFYPLGHQNVFADLPGVLRNVADLLDKEEE